jgi:hypothetical protein
VIDNAYYSTTQNASVSITQKDTSAPVINLSQPKSPVNSIQKSQTLPVSAYIQDNAQIKSINIYIDETPLKI